MAAATIWRRSPMFHDLWRRSTAYVMVTRSGVVQTTALHQNFARLYSLSTNKFQVGCKNICTTEVTSKNLLVTHDQNTQSCWKCDKDIDATKEQFFCKCGVIQPPKPERNYFEVFDIEISFDLNVTQLTTEYRKLQSLLHPDKFEQNNNTEKEYSKLQSSLVNKAYRTLLKPLPRSLYMLEIYGYALDETKSQVDSAFLMEIMEINEALVDAESLDEVERIGHVNQIKLEDLIIQLGQAFKSRNFTLANKLVIHLKYYDNIDEKVKEIKLCHEGHA